MKENRRQLGAAYEGVAAKYLQGLGYEILAYNYRNRIGEIDLIAKDEEYLCFIEVKYRSDGSCGTGLEAVNYRKQKNIIRVAQFYLMKQGLSEWTPCRFDVVSIDGDSITLIKNAFEVE